jgi:hypothetical protein
VSLTNSIGTTSDFELDNKRLVLLLEEARVIEIAVENNMVLGCADLSWLGLCCVLGKALNVLAGESSCEREGTGLRTSPFHPRFHAPRGSVESFVNSREFTHNLVQQATR